MRCMHDAAGVFPQPRVDSLAIHLSRQVDPGSCARSDGGTRAARTAERSLLAGLRPLLVSSRRAGRHPAGRGADPGGTSSRRGLRNDVGMARRPNESVAQWYERAIVTNSVAAVQQETLSEGFFANPAAREAIDQRAREAAADLELAAAAFRAERYEAKPEG